jgi:hypothetical protein
LNFTECETRAWQLDAQRRRVRPGLGAFTRRLDVLDARLVTVSTAGLEYRRHNIRLCRPSTIAPAALDQVIDSVIADLGKQYDERTLIDLALILLSPIKLGRLRTRTLATCLGQCTELKVICSGLIAKAFQNVAYPILTQLEAGDRDGLGQSDARAAGMPAVMRHYSQTLPRDFDLSPHFEVIRPGVVADGGARPVAGMSAVA